MLPTLWSIQSFHSPKHSTFDFEIWVTFCRKLLNSAESPSWPTSASMLSPCSFGVPLIVQTYTNGTELLTWSIAEQNLPEKWNSKSVETNNPELLLQLHILLDGSLLAIERFSNLHSRLDNLLCRWLCGLVVWFSLRVREVRSSIPRGAHFFTLFFCHFNEVLLCVACLFWCDTFPLW